MGPRLALVAGEPAGVGPELFVRLAQLSLDCDPVAIADPDCLQLAARSLGLPLRLIEPGQTRQPGELAILPVKQPIPTQWGSANPGNARFVIESLLRGARGCLDAEFDGLVTGPVNKASINAGGITYTGTTELLAEQAGCDVLMMLANPTLRVALATTHLPLRQVPDAITAELVERCLRILDGALRRDFGLALPRIAVLGLNPHAGEAGVLGDEEIRVIEPVLHTLRAEGMSLTGPLPADTAFLPQKLVGFDAVLAMYHDQGLPVLKHSGFEHAVNITLGLPYPRVAVDHGTALEIAGKGVADPSSLIAAVAMCSRLAARNTRA